MNRPEIILRLLRIPGDFLSVFGAFVLMYWLRGYPEVVQLFDLKGPVLLPWSNFMWFSLQAAFLVVLTFAWDRMYGLNKSVRFRSEIRRMMMLMGASFTVIILYFFIVGIHFFSRFILGGAFVAALFFMSFHRVLWRLIQHALWRKGIGCRRVLFVGGGKVLQELEKVWGKSLGFQLVGVLGSNGADTQLKNLGVLEEFEQVMKKYQVDEVVQVADAKDSAGIVEYCQLNYISYRFVPNMLEVQRTNTEIDFVHEIPIITLRSSAIDGWARVIKRVIDLIGSLFGLLLFSPLFLLVALLIKASDGGPVLYKSTRVSKDKEFGMWKFRTMVVDADKLWEKLKKEQGGKREGPLFKMERDPRITRVGRFLRKTTIDELPQLWNVLRGELSLVGPRAHMPREIAQYEKHHRKVLAVKAGVTGLAQVSGRSHLDFEQEVKLDVYYLENWSLWLDVMILFRTIFVLFEGE